MKIVFLQDDFPPYSFGGAGISTYDLARMLLGRGHEVSVITTTRQRESGGVQMFNGIRVYTLVSAYADRWRAYKSMYNPAVIPSVKEILKEIRPDVVHINNIHAHLSFYACILAKRYATRVVFTARDTMTIGYGKLATDRYLSALDPILTFKNQYAQAGLRYNPLYTLYVRYCLAQIDVRVAVSDALKDALQKNGIEDVHTVHTGVLVHEWQTTDAERMTQLELHNLVGKKIVLHNGRLSPGKGSTVLLHAMARVMRDIPEARLVVVGPPSDYMEKVATGEFGHELVGAVIFTGWIDREKVRVMYGIADIVVVPSMYLDPFPRVVLEAMASARPVIGTRYGGTPEAIQDGVTGYIVDPRNEIELAQKISDLLRDIDQARIFGEAGKKRIQESFDLSETVRRYEEEIYSDRK